MKARDIAAQFAERGMTGRYLSVKQTSWLLGVNRREHETGNGYGPMPDGRDHSGFMPNGCGMWHIRVSPVNGCGFFTVTDIDGKYR